MNAFHHQEASVVTGLCEPGGVCRSFIATPALIQLTNYQSAIM